MWNTKDFSADDHVVEHPSLTPMKEERKYSQKEYKVVRRIITLKSFCVKYTTPAKSTQRLYQIRLSRHHAWLFTSSLFTFMFADFMAFHHSLNNVIVHR